MMNENKQEARRTIGTYTNESSPILARASARHAEESLREAAQHKWNITDKMQWLGRSSMLSPVDGAMSGNRSAP